MTTITHYVGNETLVVERCWCGCLHAIPSPLAKAARDSERPVYCPLGHEWVIAETRADHLEKKLQRKRAEADQRQARRRDRITKAIGQRDKEGNNRSKLKVVAETFEFVGPKSGDGERAPSGGGRKPAAKLAPADVYIDNDDIPF